MHGDLLPIPIISVLLGALILFFGRRLFWLFVAAVGFAAGIELAPQLLNDPSPILVISAALVLGFLGALLALLLQKVAIAVVGFIAGGRLAVAAFTTFFLSGTTSHALIFLIGGIIGALLLIFLFDWALIILSAMVGAHLIQSAITMPRSGAAIVFIVLTVIGIAVQAGFARRRAQAV